MNKTPVEGDREGGTGRPAFGWYRKERMWVPLAPETLQQVSALWKRAILTEWLGPVHSGHPLWTPGGSAAAASPHRGLRRWKRHWVVLSTSCPENDKGQFPKV